MASYKGKAKHNDNIDLCYGGKYTGMRNKRRAYNDHKKINKKYERFDNDSMFVLFRPKPNDEEDSLWSKEIGINNEYFDFDDSDFFDEYKDDQ